MLVLTYSKLLVTATLRSPDLENSKYSLLMLINCYGEYYLKIFGAKLNVFTVDYYIAGVAT